MTIMSRKKILTVLHGGERSIPRTCVPDQVVCGFRLRAVKTSDAIMIPSTNPITVHSQEGNPPLVLPTAVVDEDGEEFELEIVETLGVEDDAELLVVGGLLEDIVVVPCSELFPGERLEPVKEFDEVID